MVATPYAAYNCHWVTYFTLNISGYSSEISSQQMSSFQYVQSSYLVLENRVETSPAESLIPDVHCNLVSFLSLVQRLDFDFIPAIWNALEAVGAGATANVHQSTVDISLKFAYKCTSRAFKKGQAIAFRALISEVLVLGNPSIRQHPNIVDLEGICWEVAEDGTPSPVLVFRKAHRGNLDEYLKSLGEGESSFETRRNLCLHIGRAIEALHRVSMCISDW
jgi:hypothetical protein